MPLRKSPKFTSCDAGLAAVEFALILPAFAMLMVGCLSVGLLVYSAAGLHNAVEQAARCYSVNANQCGSASATQAYALSNYYGIGSPVFTVSTPPRGHQVSATLTIVLNVVLVSWNVPVPATACFL
jgi:Flp pilus assembly protein TadG